jgi:hypothetical protein
MATMGILDHISNLNPKTIFTTREVLHYGSRGAVDTCLYRLVKTGCIRRLARGVFILTAGNGKPTIDEIADKKAISFGRQIYKYATTILQELQIVPDDKLQEKHFAIKGHSSRFVSCRGAVVFKGIAQRKAKLSETAVGQKVYALWHFGGDELIDKAVAIACRTSNKEDRSELKRSVSLMPAWLHEMFRERFGRSLARF